MSQRNPVRLAAALFLAVACATPAFAQADFSGHWAPLFHEDHPERLPGPELGDYLGIPLSEAGRLRADSYDADRISVVQEYQCRPHAGDYMMRGLANMRVDAIRDPVTNRLIAYHLRMGFQEMERTIYLDGRPRPSANAPYTWSGFSRRHVAGQRAEHLHDPPQGELHPPQRHPGERQAHVHRALGPPRELPDGADRHHRSRDPHRAARAQPDVGARSDAADGTRHLRDGARSPVGAPTAVPNHLPGTNPFLHEVADWYGLPADATRGGAETMYPEYRKTMGKPANPPPAICVRYCNCGLNGGGCNLQ